MLTTLYDFKRNWHLVEPHLNNPQLIEVLNAAMNDFQWDSYKERQRKGIPCKKPEDVFDYRKGHYPWKLCSSDAIFCSQCQTTPVDGTYRSFQLFHGCHWIARWTKRLGELMYPDYKWFIVDGKLHTVAIGKNGDNQIIFDILLFETNSPNEIIHFVKDEQPIWTGLPPHVYDPVEFLCTCWGENHFHILKYREQLEEMERHFEVEHEEDEEYLA